ncbi:DNA metabolism protein [Klebsiella michiganensis]|uniref:DNA metabolism protein n=1 Tax=Klebsiella michiganensis TaxID=1134687 RepID=A0A2J4QKR2_9ENTR|nr:DNA metabolism protein [Klebsiella oxytoca]MBX4664269.1 DNA metabolism protein [Klebsiella michiganensis]MBX4800741.1 DNA metabolism protein [Klebsiella michiganensis]MBX4820305.1 DNA metabolism protein [Klebsiella michiganensis]PLL31633.1 DNA metabolism protein [Klebsiella michiganensis]
MNAFRAARRGSVANNPHVLRVRSGSSALAVFKLSTPMTLDG